MTTLTEKFVTLEELLADQNTAILTALTTLNTNISAVNTALEILNENGAANTKALLNAIGQIDSCKPCPLPPLTIPPIDTGVIPTNSTFCKRTQAFLHAVETLLTYGDLLINGGVFTNPSAVYDAIGQAITAIGNPDTTPLPSWTETVVIAADIANYIVNNLINGYTFVELFNPLKSGLQDAIFAAGTVDGAKPAYEAYIEANADPTYAIPVFKQIAYSALWNYYFDPASTPDLTGYDGTVCTGVGTGCSDDYNAITSFSDYTAGPFPILGRDYVRIGCAGGGGGVLEVLIDGVLVDTIPIVPTGNDALYDMTGHSTYTTHGSGSTEHYYLHMQKCYGDLS